MATVNEWNDKVIAEFRANQGPVGGPFEGAPVVLATIVAARAHTTT